MSAPRWWEGDLETVREIASGGEGTVHEVRGPDGGRWAYKAYRMSTLTDPDGLERKLVAMLGSGLGATVVGGHRPFAWPQALVVDADDDLVGYCMPLVAGGRPIATVDQRKERRAQDRAHWNWATMVRISLDLARAVRTLHDAGVIWGDLNSTNVLVNDRARVTLVDLDTAAVELSGSIHAGSGRVRPEYRAPEDGGVTREADRWALAVQIHMLLMDGEHPFAAADQRDVDADEFVRRRLCPLVDATLSPPDRSPPLDTIPPGVRVLLEHTFDAGHGDPGRRPSALRFERALEGLLSDLATDARTCEQGDDHLFAAPRSSCPWCEQIRRSRDRRAARGAAGPSSVVTLAPPVSPPVSAPVSPPVSTPVSPPASLPLVSPSPRPVPTRTPTPTPTRTPTTTQPTARPAAPTGSPRVPTAGRASPGASPSRGWRRTRSTGARTLLTGLVALLVTIAGLAMVGGGDIGAGGAAALAWADGLTAEPAPIADTPKAQVGADARAVAAMDGLWVAQLASSTGTTRDERSAIMRQFRALREDHPDVRLLWSGDWSSFARTTFFVAVLDDGFGSPDEVVDWCRANDGSPRDCFARRISHTDGPEDSVVHW